MPTPVGGVAVTQASMHGSVDSAMSALGGMDSEGFLQLLVAQLRYQSPLEPSDPGDLMTQTAALAQLDATQQLLATQHRDFALQQSVAAAGLLGHEVEAVGDAGQRVQGTVDGVRYSVYGPILDVGGTEVYLANVVEVRRDAAGLASAGAPPTDPTTSPSPSDPTEPATPPSGLIDDQTTTLSG